MRERDQYSNFVYAILIITTTSFFTTNSNAISRYIEQKEERVLLANNTNAEVYKTRATSTLVPLAGNSSCKPNSRQITDVSITYHPRNIRSRNTALSITWHRKTDSNKQTMSLLQGSL